MPATSLSRFEIPRCTAVESTPEVGVPKQSFVAIVDDDDSVGIAIEALLRSAGFAAKMFQSADDFLSFGQLSQASCLIADVNMRRMNGDALHRRLVASGSRIPTVLITAYHDEGIRERALRDGVIGYLIKPFDENELLSCVRSALEAGGESA